MLKSGQRKAFVAPVVRMRSSNKSGIWVLRDCGDYSTKPLKTQGGPMAPRVSDKILFISFSHTLNHTKLLNKLRVE
jgi:hypothetical protein